MIANRIRAHEVMTRNGLAALVASTPENVRYVSGSTVTPINWTTQFYAVLPANPDHRPALIVPTIHLGNIAQDGPIDADVYVYGEFFLEGTPSPGSAPDDVVTAHCLFANATRYPGPIEALLAALTQLGLKGQAIGMDEARILPGLLERLRTIDAKAGWKPAHHVFQEIRLVKTPPEIQLLREAAAINEQGEQAVTDLVAPGILESELALQFRQTVTRLGGLPKTTTIGAGARSALPLIHRYPSRIERGDLVKYDLGCDWGGYQADTGRTVVVGQATEIQERHYAAVARGVHRVLELVRPGVAASTLFKAGVAAVREAGIPHFQRPHVGHCIGLELYDGLSLGPGERRRLEAGMVLCIETPYYDFGIGGYQLEDTIVVTDDGFEFLTHMRRDLVEC